MLTCNKCGAKIQLTGTTCTVCSAPNISPVQNTQMNFTTSQPTLIIAGVDQKNIDVYGPETESKMRLHDNNTIGLSVKGAGGVGKSGEQRVMKTFRQKLEKAGLSVFFEAGRDNHGEDGILNINDKIFTLQIVTALHDSDFWRKASISSAQDEIDEPLGAAEWLRTAIIKKAEKIMNPKQRAETVLAVDAQHTGLLSSDSILNAYLAKYGDPLSEFGFASVWLIGPTPDFCCRIGIGTP